MSSNVTTIDLRGHTGDCAVTAQRVSLLDEIQRIYNDQTMSLTMGLTLRSLLGAAIEYYGMGDQEIEECTCGGAQLPVNGTAEEVVG